MITWVNGQPTTTISVADRGLAYGDGLFETMRVQQGQPLRLELHMARLELGCQRLQIKLDFAQVSQEIHKFCAQAENAVCKLIVTRGVGQRGYGIPEKVQPQRILQLSSMPQWPTENTQGVRLYNCQTSLAIQPLLAGIKHLNRLEQVLARAEWQDASYAEGLMLDTEGHITDCVFSNIFFVRDGRLLTPSLANCGVAGVMRAWVMQQAQQLGIDCQETQIKVTQLADMDEVFTSNSLYGIWPVVSYQNYRWSVGSIARRLQQRLTD